MEDQSDFRDERSYKRLGMCLASLNDINYLICCKVDLDSFFQNTCIGCQGFFSALLPALLDSQWGWPWLRRWAPPLCPQRAGQLPSVQWYRPTNIHNHCCPDNTASSGSIETACFTIMAQIQKLNANVTKRICQLQLIFFKCYCSWHMRFVTDISINS